MKIEDLKPRTPILVGFKRTPVGAFCGALAPFQGHQLGTMAIRGLFDSAGIPLSIVERVYLGCVLQAGQGQAPARQAALNAGVRREADALTVNKVCASGLVSGCLAANDILLGHVDVVLAGGFESMTNAPLCLPTQTRRGLLYGGGTLYDTVQGDGLTDPYEDIAMGNCSDMLAKEYALTRDAQDSYAAVSYQRACKAQEDGTLAAQIVPVSIPQRKGEPTIFGIDEEPARGKPERFPELKPAFSSQGSATAANSSTINDGAAVYLLMAAERVLKEGIRPLAAVCGYHSVAREPVWFTRAPIDAVRELCARIEWDVQEVDIHEVNEAFSTVPLAYMHDLKVPHERVNIYGGAVSIGHPIGASGARILAAASNALIRTGGRRALISICNGGGGAVAMAVERIVQ